MEVTDRGTFDIVAKERPNPKVMRKETDPKPTITLL